jgi:NAD(P)-dependent dehydrogenase (short-subunit alcohol dehydrogenase family)
MNISPEQLENCLQVLQQIADNPSVIDHHDRFKSLIAKIHKQGRKKARQTQREIRQAEDRETKESCLLVQSQSLQPKLSTAIEKRHLNSPISCYICKQPYTQLHFFYHLLCPNCAKLNYQKRSQQTDLTGQTALVTGGRIKIGYQTVLRLLRDGARVIVTTRFPQDCMERYRLEKDFEQWRDRIQIHGLDLRNLPAVEAFVEELLHTESSLEILINNAAQTIKRPLAFYQHLLERESPPLLETDREDSALLKTYFPPQIFDQEGQQLDTRPINSWSLKLDQVSTIELLEVQLVNAIAPFLLNSKLKPLMLRSRFERRFIINVSAMEGQFNRESKTPFHPHTNMAKAALNMMTRTSASDYAEDNIFMNSVDTGWITDENPYPKKMHLQYERGFYPPLDIIDGMARLYDPIVQGLKQVETPQFGYFLKDYFPHPW